MSKVREAIRIVERDGWRHVRTRGSHRHYKHPVKRGTVTIAGKPGEDVPDGTWHGIMRQARISRSEQR